MAIPAPLSGGVLDYSASSTTKARPKLSPDHRRMELQGISFDDILQASDPNLNNSYDKGLVADTNAEWAEFALEGDASYVVGGTRIEALQHNVCADLKLDDAGRIVRGAPVTLPDTANGRDWLTTSESFVIFSGVTYGRRLVKTSTGYLGLASYDTLPGDIVCILFGGHVPIILRPVDGPFLFVGICYVHGIIDGEALREVDLEKESRTFEI